MCGEKCGIGVGEVWEIQKSAKSAEISGHFRKVWDVWD